MQNRYAACLAALLLLAGGAAKAEEPDPPKAEQLAAVIADYKKNNAGDLKEFAGVYDSAKQCTTNLYESSLYDPLMPTLTLISEQFMWFEGDTVVFVQFLAPQRRLRGHLTFLRDYIQGKETAHIYRVD